MTHHDFNEKLLLAKDTALDTLEDLCGPAFQRRKGIPQTKEDGTPLTWDEKEAFRRAQPPRLDAEEQHVLVMERTQRMRAATTILKTRPIGEDGNPLPISKAYPEHHTRTTPQPTSDDTSRDTTSPEGACEPARNGTQATNTADNTNTPTTNTAPRPEDERSPAAGSPAGSRLTNDHLSGGPTNTPDNANDDITTHVSSAHPERITLHQPRPAGEPSG